MADPPVAATSGLQVVPSPTIANSQLLSTAAITASDIWAVGDVLGSGGSFSTLAEHFDGTSWSVVSTPTPPKGGELFGVVAGARSDVWAVGEQGPSTSHQPLIEHWDGTSWSIVASPNLAAGGGLNAVTMVSSSNVWAVGFNSNSSDALVEHWDGTSWNVVASPAFTGAGAQNGVSADASNDVWVVGAVQSGPTILHFDGTSWSQVTGLAGNAAHNAVTALSPTDVWVVGDERTSTKHVRAMIRHWDGTSWAIVPSPDPSKTMSSFLYGVASVSASDIWAVGYVGGQTLTEHWDGSSWRIISSPNPGAGGNRLFGATALSSGIVVAVGDSFDASGVSNGLILSNGGKAPQPAATTAGTTTALPTTTPAALDANAVDQFFAAVAKADQPLSVTGHRSRARQAADHGALHVSAWDIGS
jgi:hypothetical protein